MAFTELHRDDDSREVALLSELLPSPAEYFTDEDVAVVDWRKGCPERAGFTVTAATALASQPEVDVRVATDLLAAGCPTLVAISILL